MTSPGLKKLEGLQIDIRDYDVHEIEQLGKLTTLTHLVIGCRDEHFPVLQPLSHLTDLKILGDDTRDDSLRYLALMKGLQRLLLEGAPIDGSGFKHLKDFVEMEELFIEGTNLNDEAISHIVENFPRLRRLEYQQTQVSRDGALQLASLLWLLRPGFPGEVLGPAHQAFPARHERGRLRSGELLRRSSPRST